MSNPALTRFPEHTRLMGIIVLSYPELFTAFSHCVGLALGLKYDALDALIQIESEKTKVQVGKAISSRSISRLGLTGEMDEICTSLRRCGEIRNTYAHDDVGDVGDKLYVTERKPSYEDGYKKSEITIDLLQRQLAYFSYTRSCLLHLEGTLQGHVRPASFPQKMQPPPSRNPFS